MKRYLTVEINTDERMHPRRADEIAAQVAEKIRDIGEPEDIEDVQVVVCPQRNSHVLIRLRDRIGLANMRDVHAAHEVLQRLTWIMPDPTVIYQVLDDVEEAKRNAPRI